MEAEGTKTTIIIEDLELSRYIKAYGSNDTFKKSLQDILRDVAVSHCRNYDEMMKGFTEGLKEDGIERQIHYMDECLNAYYGTRGQSIASLTDEIKLSTEALRDQMKTQHEDQLKLTKETPLILEMLLMQVQDLRKQFIKEDKNINIKGVEGERRMYEGLIDRLMYRDGYTVEQVSGIAHSCDILVKKDNHPHIRIEIKAYSNRVNSAEVEKFCRDLNECQDHGIFVSLHSSIVGRGNYEIQHLSTGKFAVYLSNNNYDVEEVISMMHLIYRLEEIVTEYNKETDGLLISSECLSDIQNRVKDIKNTVTMTVTKMKESIALIRKIDFSWIEDLILSSIIKSNKPKAVVETEEKNNKNTQRKVPTGKAKEYDIGYQAIGEDGNMYEISLNSKDVKYWMKVKNNI